MKYFIHTTGCKTNQYDSFIMVERLKKIGTFSSLEKADYFILNACTLTAHAERDARRLIERVKKEKRGIRVILTGCHAQVYPEKNFGADLVLGQKEKFEIEKYLDRRGIIVENTRDFPFDKFSLSSLNGRTRFFLKIQDGCDAFCSYCVVPFSRGKRRSRPYNEIKEVMKVLKEEGVKEVVLTGIEIGAYRDGNMDFKGLLLSLEEEETPERIRISSIDPCYIDEELIKILKNSRKIMKSIHIPLQSASDKVLEAMKRKYRIKEVEEKIDYLIEEIEDIGIGLDLLTGFPFEDEKAFYETRTFVESKNIYYLHIFPFSKREKTSAFKFKDIEDSLKRKRVKILRKIDFEKRRSFYERSKGKTYSVLVEGKYYSNSLMRGYTENYIPIYLPMEISLVNKIMRVRLKDIIDGLPVGEVV